MDKSSPNNIITIDHKRLLQAWTIYFILFIFFLYFITSNVYPYLRGTWDVYKQSKDVLLRVKSEAEDTFEEETLREELKEIENKRAKGQVPSSENEQSDDAVEWVSDSRSVGNEHRRIKFSTKAKTLDTAIADADISASSNDFSTKGEGLRKRKGDSVLSVPSTEPSTVEIFKDAKREAASRISATRLLRAQQDAEYLESALEDIAIANAKAREKEEVFRVLQDKVAAKARAEEAAKRLKLTLDTSAQILVAFRIKSIHPSPLAHKKLLSQLPSQIRQKFLPADRISCILDFIESLLLTDDVYTLLQSGAKETDILDLSRKIPKIVEASLTYPRKPSQYHLEGWLLVPVSFVHIGCVCVVGGIMLYHVFSDRLLRLYSRCWDTSLYDTWDRKEVERGVSVHCIEAILDLKEISKLWFELVCI